MRICVTGGTGSFGQAFVKRYCDEHEAYTSANTTRLDITQIKELLNATR